MQVYWIHVHEYVCVPLFLPLVIIMLSNFLCRNNAFLVNLDDMESYKVSLDDANDH